MGEIRRPVGHPPKAGAFGRSPGSRGLAPGRSLPSFCRYRKKVRRKGKRDNRPLERDRTAKGQTIAWQSKKTRLQDQTDNTQKEAQAHQNLLPRGWGMRCTPLHPTGGRGVNCAVFLHNHTNVHRKFTASWKKTLTGTAELLGSRTQAVFVFFGLRYIGLRPIIYI